MDKPDLFCCVLCLDEAVFVRMRRWISQGRDKDPDIVETRQIMLAHILSGGYARQERKLSPAVRQAVKERAKGMCEASGCTNPGAEIDRIAAHSADLSNLQYLCRDCHMKKTKTNRQPITPKDPTYEVYMTKITMLWNDIGPRSPSGPAMITRSGRWRGVDIKRRGVDIKRSAS
jgi:hypothetical protein